MEASWKHSRRSSAALRTCPKGYCMGLMLLLARKSVEPMAANPEPQRVSTHHPALHHFVAKSEWSDAAVLERVRDWVTPPWAWRAGVTGSWTTRAFPRRAGTPSGWRASIAGRWASRTTAR